MLYLRTATLDDIDILFIWANDPAVRKNSFNTNQISYEEHARWFYRTMKDNSILQFILMDDENAVGQIRLNIKDESAEIGYSIAKEYRGHGYGHKILQLTLRELSVQHPEIKTVMAKVKPDNIASKRLFESEGYKMEYICYKMNTCMQMGGALT